jgi:hypothetical protein
MNQSQEHKSQYLSAKDVLEPGLETIFPIYIDPDLDAQVDFEAFQRHWDLHLGHLQTFSFSFLFVNSFVSQ